MDKSNRGRGMKCSLSKEFKSEVSAKIEMSKLKKTPDWQDCINWNIDEKKEWTGSFPQKLKSIFKITYERHEL